MSSHKAQGEVFHCFPRKSLFWYVHWYHTHFSSGDCRMVSSPSKISNISPFSATSNSSVDPTPRWDQVKSEIQSCHLIQSQPLGHSLMYCM